MKRLHTLLIAVTLTLPLSACDTNDGPAEEAGAKIDNTMEKMGNQIEDSCEKIKEETGMKDQDC